MSEKSKLPSEKSKCWSEMILLRSDCSKRASGSILLRSGAIKRKSISSAVSTNHFWGSSLCLYFGQMPLFLNKMKEKERFLRH